LIVNVGPVADFHRQVIQSPPHWPEQHHAWRTMDFAADYHQADGSVRTTIHYLLITDGTPIARWIRISHGTGSAEGRAKR